MKNIILLFLFSCSLMYGQTLDPNKTYNIYIKSASGKILDLKDGNKNDGAKIVPERIAASKAAKFYVKSAGSGYYYIYNSTSKKVIDANKTTSSVSQWSYHGGDNQKWKLVAKPGGYYCIQNKKTGKYLDLSSKGSLIQYGFHGGNNQQFKFKTTTNTPVVNTNTRQSPKNIFFPSNTNSKFRNSLNAYANNDGWNSKKHFRIASDFNGDGHMDLIGFGDHSVYVSYGNSKMEFNSSKTITKEQFTGKQGWNSEANERFVVDLNGDNRVDLAGFSKFGLAVSYQLPNGTLQKSQIAKGSESLGNGNHWTAKKHVRTLADVNNDGYMDIIAFGDNSTYIALGTKSGTFGKGIPFDDFHNKKGYDAKKHERLVADVNNDGKKDLVGFGDNAVWAAFGNGNGTFRKTVKIFNDFHHLKGYTTTVHERQVGDINADGKQDLIAFADNKIYIALGKGNGVFSTAQSATVEMSKAKGWTAAKHHRWAIDMNNDNKADLVGFGDKGVSIAFSKSSGNNVDYKHNVYPRVAFSPKNWMSDIKDDIKISEISIPGTHDSGADYGCDGVPDELALTQNWTITQQLENGIRYLDIRCRRTGTTFSIHHDKCYQKMQFGDVLKDIKTFFAKNPSETIIMRLKQEHDATDGSEKFEEIFKKYYVANDWYVGASIPKLKDVRGKIVLIDNASMDDKGIDWADANQLIDRQDKYYHANYKNRLPSFTTQFNKAKNGSKISFNHTSGTSLDESALGVLSGVGSVIGTVKGTPKDFANYMLPQLKKLLINSEKRNHGIIIMDFPTQEINNYIIKSNDRNEVRKY